MTLKSFESIRHKFLIPFRLLPEQGLSPEKFAFSVTIGIVSGLFPVIGATTLLSLLLTMLFRQNLLVVQAVQWLIALIQIFLIIPFMHFGAFLLNQHILQLNITQVRLAFQPGLLSGFRTIGILHLYGIFAWIVLIIPLGLASYFLLLALIRRRKITASLVVAEKALNN